MRNFIDGHELQVVRTRDVQGVEGLEAVCCITCERNGVTNGFACMKIAQWNKSIESSPQSAQCKCPLGTQHKCAARTDVSFLTEDERRFFAYMADQRFRTVSEMDPEKREAQRSRWQEVAQWFVPDWDGNYRG